MSKDNKSKRKPLLFGFFLLLIIGVTLCGCSEANFKNDPAEKQSVIQSESKGTSEVAKTEPTTSYESEMSSTINTENSHTNDPTEKQSAFQSETAETSEVVKTEPTSSYEFVMSGTINTGNPHPNTIQTFEYYYYAINDGSTPSEYEVREIMADLFAGLGLIREETASYGIFLWPNLEIAEANVLDDSDWGAVQLYGPLYKQAAGTLTNHNFYNFSDYRFTYCGYGGDYMKGESWWFDGDEHRYYTAYN